MVLCGIFWRLGGDGYGLFRNPGVPITIGLAKFLFIGYGFLTGWSWWILLYIPALWGMIQAFSYGITAPPHKVWVWIIGRLKGKYENIAWRGMADAGQIPSIEVATRCTCGFFWSLPSVIFAFLTGEWILFGVYVAGLTIANGLIWYFIPNVETNERLVGTCIGASLLV